MISEDDDIKPPNMINVGDLIHVLWEDRSPRNPFYTPTFSEGCSGTIPPGESKSCTITNVGDFHTA
jgi:hypothetical protein